MKRSTFFRSAPTSDMDMDMEMVTIIRSAPQSLSAGP